MMNGSHHARVGWQLCVAGAALGALGLLGWMAGISAFTTVIPGEPAMMPNTAMALLLIGAAGAMRRREDVSTLPRVLSVLAALVVLTIGLGTLAEYALETDLHIDQFLFRGLPGPYPGRPSPPTALSLALLAGAVLVFDRAPARARPAEWLVLLAGLTALTGLMGFVFGVGPLYRLTRAPVIGVALPTAVSLLFIAVGLLFERPSAGVMRVATAAGPGGVLLRRLALPAMLFPVLLGLGVTRLLRALGADEVAIVAATLAASTMVVHLLLLTITAVPLNRVHEALELSRTRTQTLFDQAPDGIFVADLQGRYTDANDAGCRMLGYTREEIIGKTIVDLIPPEDVDRLWKSREHLLHGGSHADEWSLRSKSGSHVPVEVNAKILADGRWQGFVRDISDRKRLEKEAEQARAQLRESEERFRLAFEEAPIGMALLALDGRFVRVNRVLCEIVGYSAEELTELTFQAITHPDDLNSDLTLARQLYDGEIPRYQLEKRYIRKDGTVVDILLSGSIMRSRAGEPLRYIAQIEDITERKRLERELRLAEAKSSGILSISADAIISIDEQQRITLFNEGAERIFGYSKTEALGAPLELLIPERARSTHHAYVEAFAAGTEAARRMGQRDGMIVGVRKNGQEFPADAAISKLDVGGKRVLTVAVRDATAQKRIESEQRFLAEVGPALAATLDYRETLTRVAELAVQDFADLCIVDLLEVDDGIGRLKVASRDPANNSLCDALMQLPSDTNGGHLLSSVLETTQSLLMEHPSAEWIASLAKTEEQQGLLQGVEIRSMVAVPIVARGRLLGAIALASTTASRVYGPADVRLAEELARRAALSIENARLYGTAQRASQARDEVLSIVAHDLRNPLNSIVLQAAHLRSLQAQSSSFKPIDSIERAAKRMNRLIQDLLDVTRMEAGRLSMKPARVPVSQVVLESVEAQKAAASSSTLELRFEVAADVPEVWADRDRLLQVFDNLIGNALKFSEPGGSITVGAARREDQILFWVTDTGVGIPPEQVPHLFDRFWQARKADGRGAGLGLAIVKGIVEAHQGHIWVESTPGKGSSFFFTIPTAPAVEAQRCDQAQDVA
ncbi:MAG TPA: PAS domain S-box protein [Polyangiaceae bacterium]